ncbi:chorismate mutase [Alicyclobacillus tolerans]|uniref:chorismate mutase n=2 Tax=Alicyclobacillus tolerans TaxID=90970 RepID=A0ABT9LV38_9BACL|nr:MULTISPECIES: chorismate mutase [Alicyclobacillus]MDP9728137.1 chorismate mutase [Alicyclobacillus tengchongensis]QRF23363.1 chorismate mutase [Alicyclobacillus sp. TC]SHJ85668.1 chorismate mutase [Alicyclobacillus montanus]
MKVRGIRGAICASENSPLAIHTATRELVDTIVELNEIDVDDVASILFTMTADLTAAFPAEAVRSRPGWQWVPLMCATELPIENSKSRCIRVLMHVNTHKTQEALQHVYLGEAIVLRPDLAQKNV